MRNLIHEIHRRSLWQVLGIYIAVSWLVLQVVDVVGSNYGLPDWVAPAALILLLLGLPIVVATAFVQEGMTTNEPEPPVQSLADVGEVPPPPAPEREAHHRLFTWRNALVGGGAAFALLAVLTGAYLVMRSSGIGPAGTLVAKGVVEENQRVLLADFQSPSGDTDLASAVTEAIRIDLAQSGVISLVDRGQVQSLLRAMGRPADAPVTPEIALDAAERGGIGAVIDGQIDAAGTGFVLTVQLVSVPAGQELVSRRATASDSSEVIAAIDELSKGLRERIGESLGSIARAPALEQVATPSLRALRLYSRSENAILNEGDIERGLTLLEEALAEDSTFAMAWRKLGTERANQGLGASGAYAALDKAYEFRERLPDRDRYLTTAQYHWERGEMDRAAIAYETLLEIQPEEAFALTNLGLVRELSGDIEGAFDLYSRGYAADSVGLSQFHVARVLERLGRPGESDEALEHLRARLPDYVLVDYLEMYHAAARGDYDGAREAAREMSVRHGDSELWAVEVAMFEGAIDAIEGRLAEAERDLVVARDMELARGFGARYLQAACDLAFLRLMVAEDPTGVLAAIEAALGRVPLEGLDPLDRPYLYLAAVYALAGETGAARAYLERFDSEVPETRRGGWTFYDHHFARGELAMAEGRFSEAAGHFERGGRMCPSCALPRIARAHALAGQSARAIEVYEDFLAYTGAERIGTRTNAWWSFGDWLTLGPSEEHLARLYDEAGDRQNAAKYYAMFVELWADADDELQPRVRAAQARLEAILAEIG
ncbi:MAG: hypothetical protein R3195_03575 [Gemmatimonadota bacterium]|nr:hypothetical protein [Gemmatimonadota bacterium]